jgi:pyrroloquinoline quinone biosynthesis protein B
VILTSLLLAATPPIEDGPSLPVSQCEVELVVLGAGQDAGAPQIGNSDDDGPRLLPSSLGLIDRRSGERFLFDASPAITEQLAMLDAVEPPKEGLGVDGVFLTHAHIGHYLGLAYFGREAAGAKDVPVYAMPRMEAFLRENGPWSQLVELGNIQFAPLEPSGWSIGQETGPRSALLAGSMQANALPVDHRDEYSETVGWIIADPEQFSFLYLPDIDRWSDEGLSPEVIQKVDVAFIDATFWDDNELPGRDMSKIPHPRVKETMDLLQHLPASERAKVHFIHYNHTNPIRDPDSAESVEVLARGYNIARRGDRICLAYRRAALED